MFSLLRRKITDFLCTEEVIEKEDWEFYDYGFQLLISSVFGFLMILLLGLIRGQFWEAAFFLVCFVSLRERSGGYHADSYLGCNGALFVTGLIVLEGIQKTGDLPDVQRTVQALAVTVLWTSSPLVHKNKPVTEEERKENWKRVRLYSAVGVGGAELCRWFGGLQTAAAVAWSQMAVAALLLIGKRKEGGRK